MCETFVVDIVNKIYMEMRLTAEKGLAPSKVTTGQCNKWRAVLLDSVLYGAEDRERVR